MRARPIFAVLIAANVLAGAALAQTDASSAAPDEFGRASGHETEMIAKHSSRLSGSLGIGMTRSSSSLPFSRSGRSYNGNIGGTLIEDRLWFFASAQQTTPVVAAAFGAGAPAQAIAGRGGDVRFNAELFDRQNLSAAFSARNAVAAAGPSLDLARVPESFLSLHYTGVISSNMFFAASYSQSREAVSPLAAPHASSGIR